MTVSHASQSSRRSRVGVLRALGLALAALSLGGCFYSARQEDVTGSIPTDYKLRHPIAVREADRTVEVFVGARRGGLTPDQRTEVLAFARNWQREGTGGIIIDAPVRTSNARAAAETASETRALLVGAGVPPGAIQTRGYEPANPAKLATLKLNYPRMAAHAGPCGMWPDDLGPTLDSGYVHNVPYWNLGCATQRNLAAMVENPADLVQPRAEGPSSGSRRTVVVDKYRKGESTATNYPNSNRGVISDIGR